MTWLTHDQLSVQKKYSLVVPWILTVQINGVKRISDSDIDDNSKEDSIFKSKYQLHRRTLGDCGLVSMAHKIQVKSTKHGEQS